MTTNNTDGAALLPVTQADRDAAATYIRDKYRDELLAEVIERGDADNTSVTVQAFARHRQSHSLPGDVGMRRALERISKLTPFSANAATPEDFAATVHAIADTALSSPLPATQEDAERSGVGVIEPQYLIRKNGAYYRPKAAGYTTCIAEAGRYSLAEAIKHSHPNGPNGPRDGITYEPAPATPQRQEYDGEAVREAVKRAVVILEQGRDGMAAYRQARIIAALAALNPAQATPSAVSIPADHPLAKGLRTSQKTLDEIARQEQANIAGYLALRDFPVGSASAQFPPDDVGPNVLGSDGRSIAAQLREISRISNKYDLRECIEGRDDALGDSYIWRDLMEQCEKLGNDPSAVSGEAGEGE